MLSPTTKAGVGGVPGGSSDAGPGAMSKSPTDGMAAQSMFVVVVAAPSIAEQAWRLQGGSSLLSLAGSARDRGKLEAAEPFEIHFAEITNLNRIYF